MSLIHQITVQRADGRQLSGSCRPLVVSGLIGIVKKIVDVLRMDLLQLCQTYLLNVNFLERLGFRINILFPCDQKTEKGAQIQQILLNGFLRTALNGAFVGGIFLDQR